MKEKSFRLTKLHSNENINDLCPGTVNLYNVKFSLSIGHVILTSGCTHFVEMASHALSQMLDELMGKDRNLAPTEKRDQVHWSDQDVRKL